MQACDMLVLVCMRAWVYMLAWAYMQAWACRKVYGKKVCGKKALAYMLQEPVSSWEPLWQVLHNFLLEELQGTHRYLYFQQGRPGEIHRNLVQALHSSELVLHNSQV